jgi:hypothetical protein
MKKRTFRAPAAFLAAVLVPCSVPLGALGADTAGSLSGDWRGTSLCVANHDPCRDEVALYHLKGPNDRHLVTVVGSKIVDGREIVMGPPSDFTYDADKGTLLLETERVVFRFTVSGDKLEGTLTLQPSGVLYRRISLKKDAKPA